MYHALLAVHNGDVAQLIDGSQLSIVESASLSVGLLAGLGQLPAGLEDHRALALHLPHLRGLEWKDEGLEVHLELAEGAVRGAHQFQLALQCTAHKTRK